MLVNLWWIRALSWSVDGAYLGLENMPRILDLFLVDSRFGNDQDFVLEDEVLDGDDVGAGPEVGQ